MSDPKVLAEIYWHAYIASLLTTGEIVGARKFSDLHDPGLREAVEAGAQAVADYVFGAATGGPWPSPAPHPDDEYKLTPAGEARADAETIRYALVEQMGHRSTVGTIRETTFLGKPVLEVTDMLNGAVHTVFGESLYGISWLTEDRARAMVKPWTAVAIGAGNPDPWGVAESDLDDDEDQDEDE